MIDYDNMPRNEKRMSAVSVCAHLTLARRRGMIVDDEVDGGLAVYAWDADVSAYGAHATCFEIAAADVAGICAKN